MRSLTIPFVFAIVACGSGTTPNPGNDSGNPMGDSSTGNDAGNDTGANCDPACTTGQVCDPLDMKCKPDGSGTKIGGPCNMTGADPLCGTDPKATCNDQTSDGFPGGYCSWEPCTALQLCPIGSSCAHLGGEPGACWKNCSTNDDCTNRPNGASYECLAVDPLYISGGSHKVCFLKAFPCPNGATDCPAVNPMCSGPVMAMLCN
jgi:hypothetical protein